jgi:hypothetical protein
MPFLYLLTLRSNTEYLSLGNISSSVGISIFHLSTFFMLCPCRASALSSVATTESTCLRRSRWRYFWCRDSRHGIFLYKCQSLVLEGSGGSNRAIPCRREDAYHSRPPDSGFVRRKGPNIVNVWGCDAGRGAIDDAMF